MLHLPRTVLFSFLSFFILGSFVATFSAAILPVNGQVISEDWKYDIEEYLLEIDKNTTAEVVIYVVDSLFDNGITKDGSQINDITQLGVYIFNELPLDTPSGKVVGIGKKEKDNGVLILVAMQEQQWRIEVGYGLEGYITDIESKQIAEEYLVPKFKEGKYGEGLSYTVIALSLKIPIVSEAEQISTRGRYVYDGAELPVDEEIPEWAIILIIIFVIFMISFGGRFGGGRVGRGWGGSRGGGGRSGGGGGGGRSGGGGSGG